MSSFSQQRQRRQPRKTPGSTVDPDADDEQPRSFPAAMSLRKLPTRFADSSPSPPNSPTYYPPFAPQPPQSAKASQRYLAALLKPLLVPTVIFGLPTWPILAATCAVPIIGVMAIPLLILLSVALLYAIAWLAYLFLAQPDLPPSGPRHDGGRSRTSHPFSPLSPIRCAKVDLATLRYAITAVRIAFPAVFDWSYRRVMVLGTPKGASSLKEGIVYGSPSSHKKLDVYLPSARAASFSGGFGAAANSTDRDGRRGRNHSSTFAEASGTTGPSSSTDAGSTGAPVIVVVPSVFAPLSITSKRKLYLQLALRFRRMGYCVIVPDITYYPESRIKSSIIDLRLVLRWTGKNCQRYGGDPQKIYVMGHGLSAHLVMLTVAQEAVVLSREGHLDRAYERQRGLERWRDNPYEADDGDEDSDRHDLYRDTKYAGSREDDDEWKKSGEVGDAAQPIAAQVAGKDDSITTLGEDDVRPVEVHEADRADTSAASGDAWVDEVAGSSSSVHRLPGAVMGSARRFSSSAGGAASAAPATPPITALVHDPA
ncbi:uncharacterized protein PSFLO_07788 [Pseudozyma flocculosa]|uniref:BD-FAE-like domain-containing protein n=1 Tax=Pseudozyma flocculosa TaxID=84751 RepID=A0A5C3FF57_9BASI|nr:uncharacterized protein PSFLO_07788 [Pseudozyma flocculosa]